MRTTTIIPFLLGVLLLAGCSVKRTLVPNEIDQQEMEPRVTVEWIRLITGEMYRFEDEGARIGLREGGEYIVIGVDDEGRSRFVPLVDVAEVGIRSSELQPMAAFFSLLAAALATLIVVNQ